MDQQLLSVSSPPPPPWLLALIHSCQSLSSHTFDICVLFSSPASYTSLGSIFGTDKSYCSFLSAFIDPVNLHFIIWHILSEVCIWTRRLDLQRTRGQWLGELSRALFVLASCQNEVVYIRRIFLELAPTTGLVSSMDIARIEAVYIIACGLRHVQLTLSGIWHCKYVYILFSLSLSLSKGTLNNPHYDGRTVINFGTRQNAGR